MSPFSVKDKTSGCGATVAVPCGKCPHCLARRVSGWSFRLMEEEKVSTSAYFVTLTYDTDHVYITRNGFLSLNKKHVQDFMKRLRFAHDKKYGVESKRLKYYLAGEYGTKGKRPHYHIILFNADINMVQSAWGMGSVQFGTVTGASVGYTLKYINKPKRIPMHRNDDRQPEFALMSKGLGDAYVRSKMVRWHHADLNNRMYLVTSDNKKVAMPRYYKERIYTKQEKKIVGFHSRKKMLQQIDKIQSDPVLQRNQIEADKALIAKTKRNSEKGGTL